MLSDIRLIYWDACVPLAYINGEVARLAHLEGILEKSGKDFQLITSVYTVTEVAFGKLEQDKKQLNKEIEDKIRSLWRPGSPVQLVEFYELIAVKAAALIRNAISKSWSLKPGDAIHLATADHLKVVEFQTYDDKLDKFSAITETHFSINRPIADQPVLVTAVGPLPAENQTIESEVKHERAAATADTAVVQGSGDGHTEGQAAVQAKPADESKTEIPKAEEGK